MPNTPRPPKSITRKTRKKIQEPQVLKTRKPTRRNEDRKPPKPGKK
jgi:hypothetical protein